MSSQPGDPDPQDPTPPELDPTPLTPDPEAAAAGDAPGASGPATPPDPEQAPDTDPTPDTEPTPPSPGTPGFGTPNPDAPDPGLDRPPPPPGPSTPPPPGAGHAPPPPGGGMGAAAPPPPPPPATAGDERTWAIIAHLAGFVSVVGIPSPLGPLVVWLIRRDRRGADLPHAVEALNFHISLLIYGLAAAVLALVTFGLGLLVILPVAIAVVIAAVVFMIIGAVKASNGEPFRYPLTIRMVKV